MSKRNSLNINNPYLQGILLILAGLFTLFIGVESGTLQCNRSESIPKVCQLTNIKLLEQKSQIIPIEKIISAKVEKGNKSTYRLVILTRDGTIPLTNSYTKGYQVKVNRINEVNDFISNQELTSLAIKQNNSWIALPFGFLFIISGVLSIIWGKE